MVKILGPLGGYRLVRWLMRTQPRILMYHRFSAKPNAHCVSADAFEQQLVYIKRHFNVISLSQLREFKEQGTQPPKNAIVLTVDDGYRDFYEVAYPLLKKYNLPATLFVTTGFVNQELWLWPDKVTCLLARAEMIPAGVELGDSPLEACAINSESKPAVWSKIVAHLLSIADQDKHLWIDRFAEILRIELSPLPPKAFQACTWEELNEMQSQGIEIGGHTHTHPSLGQVDADQLHLEIAHCKSLMDEYLGVLDRDFCYPNGQPTDYSDEAKTKLKEFGFRSSVTAFYDKFALSDIYEMRRHVGAEENFQFWKSVNGVESMMAAIAAANNISIGKLS